MEEKDKIGSFLVTKEYYELNLPDDHTFGGRVGRLFEFYVPEDDKDEPKKEN